MKIKIQQAPPRAPSPKGLQNRRPSLQFRRLRGKLQILGGNPGKVSGWMFSKSAEKVADSGGKLRYQPVFQWDTPVQYVKGVGPRAAETLKKTLCLYCLGPYSLASQGFSRQPIGQKPFCGAPRAAGAGPCKRFGKADHSFTPPPKNFYVIVIGDSTGRIACKFFRLPYKQWFNSLREGDLVGGSRAGGFLSWRIEFHHPQIFPQSQDKAALAQDILLPVYTETEPLKQSRIRQIMKNLLKAASPAGPLLEKLPLWLRQKYKLVDRYTALKRLHSPDPGLIDSYMHCRTPFQERVIFD